LNDGNFDEKLKRCLQSTLEELVEYSGGKVTWYASEGAYHITGKPKKEEKNYPCVDKQWLFDCVFEGKILPLDYYLHQKKLSSTL